MLWIGLQSGFGLHPDQFLLLPKNFKLPKNAEIVFAKLNSCFSETLWTRAFQLSILAITNSGNALALSLLVL
jgi:hypothetical protein